MLNPYPSVSKACSIVLQEEQQKEIKNFNAPIQMDVKATTFLANQRKQFLSRTVLNPPQYTHADHSSLQYSLPFNAPSGGRRSNVQCNYCKKLGHTIEKCFKLQRVRSQSNQDKRVAVTVQQSHSTSNFENAASNQTLGHHTLTAEQYEQVLALLTKQNMEVTTNIPSQHSGFLAGKAFYLLSTKPELSWVVDSGASDHITPHLHLFKCYTQMTQRCFITMPNGKKVQIKHIGIVELSTNLTLHDVLHVPEFQFNLLSASKLAKHLSTSIVFTPNSCYIQDHLKDKKVVLGEENGGLYLVKPFNAAHSGLSL